MLVFDRVPKAPYVGVGDTVITAGSLGRGALPSMFPRGIQIGTVASSEQQRRQHVQDDPGGAVRQLRDAAVGDRAGAAHDRGGG